MIWDNPQGNCLVKNILKGGNYMNNLIESVLVDNAGKLTIWEKIVVDGIKTNYSISNTGFVRNDNTGNYLKQKTHMCGYLTVGISIPGEKAKQRTMRVHRLVAEAFIPNPDNKRTVNHKDGNKKNNNVENLEWMTHKENIQHAIDNGLMQNWACGERSGAAKYSEETVRKICQLIQDLHTPKDICEILGVPRNLVNSIRRGKWKSISSEYNFPNLGYFKKIPRGPRKIPDKKIELAHAVCKLAVENKSVGEISKILGVPVGFVTEVRNPNSKYAFISSTYNMPQFKFRNR